MKNWKKYLFCVLLILFSIILFFEKKPEVMAEYAALATIVLIITVLISVCVTYIKGQQGADREEEYIRSQQRSDAGKRLKGVAASFSKLSGSFKGLVEEKENLDVEDAHTIMEDVSDHLCKGCRMEGYCWTKHYEESYQVAMDLFTMAVEKGELCYEDIPASFKEMCVRIPEVVEETNRNLSLAKLKMTWHNRMAESRFAVASQLQEISNIVSDFAIDFCDDGKIIEVKKRKITAKLRAHHIRARSVLMFERENRGMELHLSAKCTEGRCVTTKETAQLIGQALNKKFIPREDARKVIGKEYADYVFCEDANYRILTGIARVSKNRDETNGDSFSFLYPDSQDVMMMLADGMGTGDAASKESEMVIELLEQFLEAGFREEPAIRLINSVLVLRSEQMMFSTLDISLINLCAGTCDFVKIGAATTFIKRDQFVEIIGAQTMPIGVKTQVDYQKKTKKLYDGDYIIMVSDGVLDCISDEEKESYLQKLILSINYKSPQDLANAILTAALEQHEYVPVDDMTVLVTGIWRK